MEQITLKAARVNVNLTQAQAAKELNISVSTLKRWEKGIAYPNQPQIEALCSLYKVSYDRIFFA